MKKMRDIVIQRLTDFIKNSNGYGIKRVTFCEEEEFITDAKVLPTMTDEELLEAYDANIGFEC